MPGKKKKGREKRKGRRKRGQGPDLMPIRERKGGGKVKKERREEGGWSPARATRFNLTGINVFNA